MFRVMTLNIRWSLGVQTGTTLRRDRRDGLSGSDWDYDRACTAQEPCGPRPLDQYTP